MRGGNSSRLRLGTRGSLLARTQSGTVARALEAAGARVDMVTITTTGDRRTDRPLPEIGGKGLFTRELDEALLSGDIDLAVHSLKDLPTDDVPGLRVAAVPEREDARDALVGPGGTAVTLRGLPDGARVGTSSLRRRALLLAFRPDLSVENVRGNLDTRLRKLDEGRFDALVLAAAGLRRMGLAHRIGEYLERTAFVPAPGQGALGIVAREEDRHVAAALDAVHHPASHRAVRAERTLLAALEGGCQVPIAALGLPYDGGIRLWGLVASPDGRRVVKADATGGPDEPEALGTRVAGLLERRGARELLEAVSEAPAPGLTHP